MRPLDPSVIEHEGEQLVIRSVLEMKEQGFLNTAIAHALQAMKISTKKCGKRWHPDTVRQILRRAKAET